MTSALRSCLALVGLAVPLACRSAPFAECEDAQTETAQTGNTGELGLTLFAAASPGLGGGLAFDQRLAPLAGGNLAFELGGEHQELDDEGPRGDDFARAFAGLRFAPRSGESGPTASLGVSWMRSEGEADALDGPGDYGGAHLGLGWAFPNGERFASGPELVLSYVDAEGDQGGSGLVVELLWRLVFRL